MVVCIIGCILMFFCLHWSRIISIRARALMTLHIESLCVYVCVFWNRRCVAARARTFFRLCLFLRLLRFLSLVPMILHHTPRWLDMFSMYIYRYFILFIYFFLWFVLWTTGSNEWWSFYTLHYMPCSLGELYLNVVYTIIVCSCEIFIY